MSDEVKREAFGRAVPKAPEPEHPDETHVETEQGEELIVPARPLTDEQTYPPSASQEGRVTHEAMSAEQLAEIGCDEDGNPIQGAPKPVEPEEDEDV